MILPKRFLIPGVDLMMFNVMVLYKWRHMIEHNSSIQQSHPVLQGFKYRLKGNSENWNLYTVFMNIKQNVYLTYRLMQSLVR